MKREEKAKLSKREQFAQLRSDFTTFLYNKEGDEPAVVMGRTALSWGKIGLFFLVYYACLAAFFAAIFAIAFSTMPEIEDGPKYTSFISDKPLLLVYPENGIGSWKREDIDRSIKTKYENFLDGRYNFTPLFIVKKNCSSGHKIMVDQ
ncbi:sodium potassium-transporting ATPase subunit beta-1-like [Paramuricea clavata]|uniref:Sodium potassium-transporting ATPase subunit beta-1-like n=1 Tax=Paramuricea clavata TaxID=317549 RepID=A0A7D9JWH6_PARCT|nr:sodium potassium-transporting ATPase subunit beta-1-like [Paramuricea clavata]